MNTRFTILGLVCCLLLPAARAATLLPDIHVACSSNDVYDWEIPFDLSEPARLSFSYSGQFVQQWQGPYAEEDGSFWWVTGSAAVRIIVRDRQNIYYNVSASSPRPPGTTNWPWGMHTSTRTSPPPVTTLFGPIEVALDLPARGGFTLVGMAMGGTQNYPAGAVLDVTNIRLETLPEPGSWLLLALGLGFLARRAAQAKCHRGANKM
jgi:hypothetical protein